MKEQAPETRQLFFKEKSAKTPGKPGQGVIGKTVSGEVHRQVAQNEEDNTGLQALHTSERLGEGTLYTAQQLRYKSQQHAKIHSQSRANQRKAIRQEYMMAKAGRSTNRNAQKAVKRTAETSESVITFIAKKKSLWMILALGAMLLLVMNTLSSCTPLVEAALHELSQDVQHRLRKYELVAQGVQVTVKDNDLDCRQYQMPLSFPTQSCLEIASAGYDLFKQRYHWAKPVRALTIRGINVIPVNQQLQLDIFHDAERRERRRALENAVDANNEEARRNNEV